MTNKISSLSSAPEYLRRPQPLRPQSDTSVIKAQNYIDSIMRVGPNDYIARKFGDREKDSINRMVDGVAENVYWLDVEKFKNQLLQGATKEVKELVNSLTPIDILELVVTTASVVALTSTGIWTPLAMALIGRFALKKWAGRLIQYIVAQPNLKVAIRWFLGIKNPRISTTAPKSRGVDLKKETSKEVWKLMWKIMEEFGVFARDNVREEGTMYMLDTYYASSVQDNQNEQQKKNE